MKHFRWPAGRRKYGKRAHHSRRAPRKLRNRTRRFAFEPLEERLVFALQLNIALDAISENGGVAIATVSRTGNLTQPLTVNLASSDTTEATAPASVVIGANKASATFNVTAVDDSLLDDGITVAFLASATGHTGGSDAIRVLNDDFVALSPWPAADVVNVSPRLSGLELALGPAVVPDSTGAWHARFAGRDIYQTAGTGVSVESDAYFPVDLTKAYGLAGWAKSGDEFGQRFNAGNLQSFGFASYDVDRQPILPEHVLRFPGAADTTLAAPLDPGDTTIQLASAGWSNSSSAPAATRVLAWYGYEDSQGTTYANYTYTRNVALGGENGLWAPGGVSGNVVTLAAPWSGPALPAGTAVRNTGDGSEATLVLDSESVPNDWTWTQYAGVFGGVLQNGNDSATGFRPGTAFIKPVIVANEHGAADNFFSWRDVSITEVAADTTAEELAPPVVDLSVVTTGDQRHTLALPAATPYSWSAGLVKVNTSERYTLATWARNQSNIDERPLGFASFDVDKKLVHPLHVTKHAFAADTTLAAELAPGDNWILITNASGWSNEAWESADTRALAWYGYTDSTGHTYPDYTYTRNVAFDFDAGLWSCNRSGVAAANLRGRA